MLECLQFEIGGFFDGFYEVTIQNTEGALLCRVCFPFERDHRIFVMENVDKWLSDMENVAVRKWRSKYYPDEDIQDGLSWSLQYKAIGKRWRHIEGQNCFPDNWDQFLQLISSIDTQLELSRFNRSENDD